MATPVRELPGGTGRGNGKGFLFLAGSHGNASKGNLLGGKLKGPGRRTGKQSRGLRGRQSGRRETGTKESRRGSWKEVEGRELPGVTTSPGEVRSRRVAELTPLP